MDASPYVHDHAVPAALGMLPEKMTSKEAQVLLLAIGFQESNFVHRQQVRGPARGWWQFERIGVLGVLKHHSSKDLAATVAISMGYPDGAVAIHNAVRDNDVLAAVFARLLLWTHPRALPSMSDTNGAWDYYLTLWRPGKPHSDRWDRSHRLALELVETGE